MFGFASILDFNQSDVLDSSDQGLLGFSDTEVNSFFLAHSEDGELPSGSSTGQVSGDDNSVPEVSAGVVTWSAVEFRWGNVSKNWLLLAASEVDGLYNLINFLSIVAEFLEGFGPWEFTISDFLGIFERFRVSLSLSQFLVGHVWSSSSSS
jgi:hypothetical protein